MNFRMIKNNNKNTITTATIVVEDLSRNIISIVINRLGLQTIYMLRHHNNVTP